MTDHIRVRAVVVGAEYACDVCWSVDFGVLGYSKLVDCFGRKEKEQRVQYLFKSMPGAEYNFASLTAEMP